MEEIEKNRSLLRKRFEKLKEEILALLRADPVDKEELEARHQIFGENFQGLCVWDERAIQRLKEDQASEEVLLKEIEEVDSYNVQVKLLKIKIDKILSSDLVTEPTNSIIAESSSNTAKKTYRLPNVEIKKFNGKLTEWLSFWAQFQRIHEDQEMNASDKFWYLLDALEKGTEVHELVKGYPQSAENYPVVIDVLKRRYSNDVLLQVYIRQMLGLVISNLNSKEKLPFEKLFVQIDSHLRSLRSLNVEKADPATWLFPLVESSLPDEVLISWQRSPLSKQDGSSLKPPQTRLDFLLKFMEEEVQIRQRVTMSHSFSKETTKGHVDKPQARKDSTASKAHLPTVANFHVGQKESCFFCERSNHSSKKCFHAPKMSHTDKVAILRRLGLCFVCFAPHLARNCNANVSCRNCKGRHETVMCTSAPSNKRKSDSLGKDGDSHSSNKRSRQDNHTSGHSSASVSKIDINLNQVISSQVYLQTLYCMIQANGKVKKARTFIDLGSQRSYVRKRMARQLELVPIAKEKVVHSLFGGITTKPADQFKFMLKVGSLFSDFTCNFEVRDKNEICESLSRISPKKAQELGLNDVQFNDVGTDAPPIDLLIGADNFGKILTGEMKDFGNGVFGINTKLGWTIIGELQEQALDSKSICMSIHDKQLPHLWDLELLGIRDPVEVLQGKDLEKKLHQDFIKGVTRMTDGRYVVKLPWKEGHPALPTNYKVAVKRLDSTTRKLVQTKLFDSYDTLFKEWKAESFIEEVLNPAMGNKIHYLPHRAVIKASLTTPVRPVFDASCKEKRNPSLNDCLQKGCNLIALIPDLLLKFRKREVAFVSDIRKAFQMIGVAEEDRDSFRFLWWKDFKMEEMVQYRHARVPFGATCSPFILGAVIKLHLESSLEFDEDFRMELLNSFYVDNCVNSVDSMKEYHLFKENAVKIMRKAQMELRMWMSNKDIEFDKETQIVSVLGVMWDRMEDSLFVETSKINTPEKITKRSTLSSLNKIYDPVGWTSPVSVQVKILLQKAWINKLRWDDELPEEEKIIMKKWYSEVDNLSSIHVPRLIMQAEIDDTNLSLHIFVDASQHTFATVLFLRIETYEGIKLSFMGAKSRIAPPKKRTIPRMELLAAVIGTFLSSAVKESLKLKEVETHFWSDSTTVLAWIRRNDKWGTFVGNRVNKILSYSRGEQWRYVPTNLNPADLPSRGCSPKQLVDSKWWEGPEWLKEEAMMWPVASENFNEAEILEEKGSEMTCLAIDIQSQMKRSHSFNSYIRIFGWIDRFIRKSRKIFHEGDEIKELSAYDLEKGETRMFQFIQNQFFSDEQIKRLKHLEFIRDDNNLLRVKTRITEREDGFNFKFPIVLPGNHPIIKQLVYDLHLEKAHAGIGIMLASLREKYWLLQARRNVKKVLCNCYRCGRFAAKQTLTPTAPLPLNRIRDAEPFEVTGVDLAGPLLLKNGKKVWMVIYTCAVYRAVHLQIIQSLNTRAFIHSFMKFAQRFRRPVVVYSDNGTNFHGANNLFAKLNWHEIKNENGLSRIKWVFNPSTGSWWGGFWERLIKSVKDLLRKTLGNAIVKLQELKAVIWTVEQAMNQRPLTYVSEDIGDLEPLTPEMFVHPLGVVDFPESEMTDGEKLRFRFNHVRELRKQLKERFRKEYLALLVSRVKKTTRKLRVGELVYIASDNKKRLDWPLARILELFPSQKDGVSRVARVKTKDGIYDRPVQRLYPLEADQDPEQKEILKKKISRSGREIRTPHRYQ